MTTLCLVLSLALSKVCDFRLNLQTEGQHEYSNGTTIYSLNHSFYASLGFKTRAASTLNQNDIGAGKHTNASWCLAHGLKSHCPAPCPTEKGQRQKCCVYSPTPCGPTC